MLDLEIHGSYEAGSLLQSLRPRESRRRVSLDLGGMTFCEPIGLVGIASAAEGALRAGLRVIVLKPRSDHVARYLARMRLGRVLSSLGAEHDLPLVREHRLQYPLLELTHFDGSRGAGVLAAMVHAALEGDDLEAANALHEGLSETGQNVAQHTPLQRGYIAAQRTYGGHRLLFAVGDSGPGMLETLRVRGATTDQVALQLALTRGVSSKEARGRGAGLPDVVDHLRMRSGSLHIVSGAAAVTASGPVRRAWTSGALPWPGTVLQGALRCRGFAGAV